MEKKTTKAYTKDRNEATDAANLGYPVLTLRADALERAGLHMTVSRDDCSVHIIGAQRLPEETFEAGRDFAARLGLDVMATQEVIDFAIRLQLWSAIRHATDF